MVLDLPTIRLYREFYDFILGCLITSINSYATTFLPLEGRKFQNHMNVAVYEYLVPGDGHFVITGSDGLIKTIKRFVPATHWLPTAVSKLNYNNFLNKLSALRNFATHVSAVSNKRLLGAIDHTKLSSSGTWRKNQNRIGDVSDKFKELATEIENVATY